MGPASSQGLHEREAGEAMLLALKLVSLFQGAGALERLEKASQRLLDPQEGTRSRPPIFRHLTSRL